MIRLKVVLINGSPRENGCTFTALSEIKMQLEKNDIEAEIFHIGKGPIRGCTACGVCKREKLGHCVFSDDRVNECIERLNAADGMVIGVPVYYAGPAGSAMAFMDRIFYSKKSFANKVGAGIVSCRRGGASATFDRLNKYFAISSMPIATSQYWNSVHGNTPDEVRQDLEGLQVMRMLANNMAWLLKCIEAGKNSGVPYPATEPRVLTSFIR